MTAPRYRLRLGVGATAAALWLVITPKALRWTGNRDAAAILTLEQARSYAQSLAQAQRQSTTIEPVEPA